MALVNPTLHDPGPTAGSAAHWTIASVCSAQRLAAFGPAPERALEDFGRFATFKTSFPDGALVLALFGPVPKGVEAFDGWAGGAFLDAFPEVLLDGLLFDGSGAERFDRWLDAAWAAAWDDVTGEAAVFGSRAGDDFEAWSSPTSSTWAAAAFDGAAPAERFDGAWAAMTSL